MSLVSLAIGIVIHGYACKDSETRPLRSWVSKADIFDILSEQQRTIRIVFTCCAERVRDRL